MTKHCLKLSGIIMISLLLGACAGAFKKPDTTADWGPAPENYEQKIKAYYEVLLKDPDSARYRFSPPVKGWVNEGLAYGGGIQWMGWMVNVDINARNSFGGYTGAKPHWALFTNGEIVRHIEDFNHPLIHVM